MKNQPLLMRLGILAVVSLGFQLSAGPDALARVEQASFTVEGLT